MDEHDQHRASARSAEDNRTDTSMLRTNGVWHDVKQDHMEQNQPADSLQRVLVGSVGKTHLTTNAAGATWRTEAK